MSRNGHQQGRPCFISLLHPIASCRPASILVVAESDRQEPDNETSNNATPQRRRRCPGLSSYNEEFGATSLIDAYLYSGQVSLRSIQ